MRILVKPNYSVIEAKLLEVDVVVPESFLESAIIRRCILQLGFQGSNFFDLQVDQLSFLIRLVYYSFVFAYLFLELFFLCLVIL
jgi:hypothetical protein